MNLLNKAFADIEKTVADKVQKAALSVVDVAGLDEFPTPQSANDSKGKLVVTGSSAARARAAFKAWSELDFDGHKAEWELLVRELKGLSQKTADVPDQQWQQRARDAEYKLYQVCSVLLDAPDPAPFIESVSSLSSKIVGECTVTGARRQGSLRGA